MVHSFNKSFLRCYASFNRIVQAPPTIPSMSAPPLQFRPRWLPTLATLLVMGLTGYLGTWQKHRADEKRQLQVEFESRSRERTLVLDAKSRADDLRYRRARAIGVWHDAGPVFVDNRIHDGRAGFHVLVPFALEQGGLVLVQRGWLGRDAAYPRAPSFAPPVGRATIVGTLDVPGNRFIEWTMSPVQGNVWQNLTIERYRTATGRDVLPYVLVEETPPIGIVPTPVQPDARADKHIEYMWTWYSLCATVFFLWILMNFKRRKIPGAQPTSS